MLSIVSQIQKILFRAQLEGKIDTVPWFDFYTMPTRSKEKLLQKPKQLHMIELCILYQRLIFEEERFVKTHFTVAEERDL